jgi:hypothetical protein
VTQVKRTLLVVDRVAVMPVLHEVIALRCPGGCEVFVIAPNRNRALVDACIPGLARRGVVARGWPGPSDPLAAVSEALRRFAADEIVIAAEPHSESRRLGVPFARRAGQEFKLPVVHLAVAADVPVHGTRG